MVQPRQDIERLLNPRAVAVLGPIDRGAPEKFVASLRDRFGDRFHLVDSEGGTVAGRPVSTSLEQLTMDLDVAVIDFGAAGVCAAAEACARRGVPNLLVTTALGKADDPAGDTERRLLSIIRDGGMRMVGPNASLNLYERMPVAPGAGTPKIGLITQSGHMGRVVIQSHGHGVAFSRWIPTGNEADLEGADFIEYFAYDPQTAVIAGYFEGFRDGANLRRALAAAAAQDKPVVLVKVGRHEAASRMAETHSAHLTGSDAVVDGLLSQYGAIRVGDVDELIETAALCAKLQPRPRGEGVALYGISGAAVALMADQAQNNEVLVPQLTSATQDKLHIILPADLGVSNPVDPGNLYRTGDAEARRSVLRTIIEDPGVDVLVCALTGVIKGITDDFVADIIWCRDTMGKPVVTTWNTWDMTTPAYTSLVESGIPIFRSFRGCFGGLRELFEWQRRAPQVASRPPVEGKATPQSAAGPHRLNPSESAALLNRYGIPLVAERVVANESEVRVAASQLGFPVVLKAHIAESAHKSDAGLVRLDLRSTDDVLQAFRQIQESAVKASASGDIVYQLQHQAVAATELLVGLVRDPVFGPAMLVGAGGIFAEVLDDVSVRPLPVTRLDAEEMLGALRCYPLLTGVRGRPAADIGRIVNLLLAVSAAAGDAASGIVELDLNPVIAGPEGAIVVDSVVIVDS
jgi:acyl-CoA synthetase (NDP forming)